MPAWHATLEVFRLIVLFGMLGWATYTDFKRGRIPNVLTVTGLLVGFGLAAVLSLVDQGFGEHRICLLGLLAGGGPFLVIYLVGLALDKPLMGAGDVKLMAAVGALVGPLAVLLSIAYGLIVSGVWGLAIVAYCAARGRSFPRTIALGACLCIGTVAAFCLNRERFSPLFWHGGQLFG